MTKAMKKSSREQSPPPSEEHESVDTQAKTLGSDQDQDPEVSSHPAVPLPSVPTPPLNRGIILLDTS